MDDSQQNKRNDERELQVSPKFKHAFRSLQKETIFIPPQVDEAVLKYVRPHLAQIRKPKKIWNKQAQILAIAAAFVLLCFVTAVPHFVSRPHRSAPDLNVDGRLDILDAFQLSRDLKNGKTPDLDLNGDGRTDALDVDVIARRSVSLGKGDS